MALLTSCGPNQDGPPPEAKHDAVTTIEWIRGEGRAAVAVHNTVQSLLSAEITTERCQAAVDALDGTAEPIEVAEMISKVPNADLRAALDEEQGLFQAVVGDRLQQRLPAPDMDVDQLRTASDIVTALVQQLEKQAR